LLELPHPISPGTEESRQARSYAPRTCPVGQRLQELKPIMPDPQ